MLLIVHMDFTFLELKGKIKEAEQILYLVVLVFNKLYKNSIKVRWSILGIGKKWGIDWISRIIWRT